MEGQTVFFFIEGNQACRSGRDIFCIKKLSRLAGYLINNIKTLFSTLRTLRIPPPEVIIQHSQASQIISATQTAFNLELEKKQKGRLFFGHIQEERKTRG